VRTKAEIEGCFAPREALDQVRSFVLVGIGGAGMSGIARMLHRAGLEVRGTDAVESDVTEDLRRLGLVVSIGHTGDILRPGDALVLTDAIELGTSPEVARARELAVPLFRRSQVLGWLLRSRKTIAITGTHGKTTTTGLVGAALVGAGLDPTIVVGAEVPDFGGAVREGSGEWAVVEACEAYDGLRDLDPQIVVLTNLELDHVDFHESMEALEQSVRDFVERIPSTGSLIYCSEDAGACRIASTSAKAALPYELDQATAPQLARLPGRHNRLNATAAMKVAELLGAPYDAALRAVEAFGGAGRRLEILREGPIAVVDDYAHHPTEIEASIGALRERFPGRRLVVVYQPHLYSRTAGAIPEFARTLSLADFVVLTDIYPAREVPMPGVSSARIVEGLTVPSRYVPQRHLLPRAVAALAEPGDVIVGMGAGTIAEFAPAFLAELDRGGPLRVAVVYGGDSAEREISLHSGSQVAEALAASGCRVTTIDVSERLLTGTALDVLVGPNRPDVVFLTVHGTNAEDGAIQGLLELLHLPYTGSGIAASALAMDKEGTKRLLAGHGLPVPRGVVVKQGEVSFDFLPGPWVIKPNKQGSTVGLSFVDDEAALPPAIAKALAYGEEVLVEERVAGTEISVPVLGDRALPAVEIVPASGRYDFAAKYLPGATEEICPARLPADVLRRAEDYSLRAHRALGCEGATRTDMIVRDDGECVILEVNTLPGLTATSLLPNSARVAGIEFSDLCEWMVEDARARFLSRNTTGH